jgi:DNA-binding response OmpR family regulator
MATVLVVDDEPDIRYLVKVNLELDGHTVRTAANGVEALDEVRRDAPDVVLLDVMMPEIDGWAVLETIKAEDDQRIKTIPVVMLTAFGGDENEVRGGIEGAIRYLTKPISPEELRNEVKAAVEGEPEPVKRRKVQQRSLEQLARMETGGAKPDGSTPRPRLTRLERTPVPAAEPSEIRAARERLPDLTAKQRELLETLRDAPSVSSAASSLGVSRSNIYASLRRINRKLGTGSVPELLLLVRDGSIFDRPANS